MKTRLLRAAAWSCLLAAMLAAAVGSVMALVRPSPEPGLMLDRSDIDLGELTSGETTVVLRVTNASSRSAEAVQPERTCGRDCCLRTSQGRNIPVSPRQTVELIWQVSATKPGPFELTTEVYLVGENLQIVSVRLHGVRTSAGGETNVSTRR